MKRIIVLFAFLLLALSAVGQNRGRFGIDATADCFLPADRLSSVSIGIGARARLGERDQWLNLVSGLRYIYGHRLSGFQIPIMLNVNLLKMDWGSGYLGGGFEFDFFGRYLGCMKYQIGLAGDHLDFRVFYKPYQGDLGAGVTYYF